MLLNCQFSNSGLMFCLQKEGQDKVVVICSKHTTAHRLQMRMCFFALFFQFIICYFIQRREKVKCKRDKRMKRERGKKFDLGKSDVVLWSYCQSCQHVSGISICCPLFSEFSASRVLLRLPAVFLLLCCLLSDRPAYDRKTHA